MNTNSVPDIGDYVVSIVPAQYQHLVCEIFALLLVLGRVYQAYKQTGSLSGIFGNLLKGTNSVTPRGTTPPGSSQSEASRLPVLLAIIGLAGALCCIEACSSNQQTAAYKAASATDAAVRGAMTGWGAYVAVAQPGTNTEARVFQAFSIYQAAELAVIDASSALATNPAATNAVTSALVIQQSAGADLLALITSITNKP
jgi:hypothetical protein